jgi:Flp pilus assembly protein TadD
MFARLRLQSLFIAGFVFAACTAWAQTGGIEGKVTGEDGTPLKGALVKFTREDIKGNYKVTTDKRGHYIYTGLPLGKYKVSVEVDGTERDSVDNVHNSFGGDAKVVDFDLHAKAQQRAALNKAAETGSLSKEQERGLTAEQKAAIANQMKEVQKLASKNKALNEAFNAGRTALGAGLTAAAQKQNDQASTQFTEAVTQFNKAAEVDENQGAIWSNLAEAYVGLGDSKVDPAEKQATYEKGFDAYKKAIALLPTDGALHNNYALALVKVKKIDDAQQELQTAATLDPSIRWMPPALCSRKRPTRIPATQKRSTSMLSTCMGKCRLLVLTERRILPRARRKLLTSTLNSPRTGPTPRIPKTFSRILPRTCRLLTKIRTPRRNRRRQKRSNRQGRLGNLPTP